MRTRGRAALLDEVAKLINVYRTRIEFAQQVANLPEKDHNKALAEKFVEICRNTKGILLSEELTWIMLAAKNARIKAHNPEYDAFNMSVTALRDFELYTLLGNIIHGYYKVPRLRINALFQLTKSTHVNPETQLIEATHLNAGTILITNNSVQIHIIETARDPSNIDIIKKHINSLVPNEMFANGSVVLNVMQNRGDNQIIQGDTRSCRMLSLINLATLARLSDEEICALPLNDPSLPPQLYRVPPRLAVYSQSMTFLNSYFKANPEAKGYPIAKTNAKKFVKTHTLLLPEYLEGKLTGESTLQPRLLDHKALRLLEKTKAYLQTIDVRDIINITVNIEKLPFDIQNNMKFDELKIIKDIPNITFRNILLEIHLMDDYINIFKELHKEFIRCCTAFIEQFNEDNLKFLIESNLGNLKFALHIIQYFGLPESDRIYGNDSDVVIATYNANPTEFLLEALSYTPINTPSEEDNRSYELPHESLLKRLDATMSMSSRL